MFWGEVGEVWGVFLRDLWRDVGYMLGSLVLGGGHERCSDSLGKVLKG